MKDNNNITVIIPCRNEERHIGKCIESVIDNDYPKDKFELFVIDGMSEDNTTDIIRKYIERYPFITFFENAKIIQSSAMNIGVRHAKGDIIIRMDAHTTYDNEYISKCVNYLKEYNADNVGGICITLPGNNTTMAKSIATALSHPFGVGNSYFRIGLKEPMYVDTVPFGCYRKEVFDRIGLINEDLVRNQDIEFNIRLKNAGGKILLVPDIVSYYYARTTLKALAKNSFGNGFWVIYSTKFANMPFSIRHLVPFVFVLSLFSSLLASLFYFYSIYVFAITMMSYLAAITFFSIKLSVRKGYKFFPHLIATFITLHVSYGVGSFFGLLKLMTYKLRALVSTKKIVN